MDKNSINKERVVSLVGFIFLVVAAITGFMWNGDQYSILHRIMDTAILIPWTHVICAAMTFYLIFKPKNILFIVKPPIPVTVIVSILSLRELSPSALINSILSAKL